MFRVAEGNVANLALAATRHEEVEQGQSQLIESAPCEFVLACKAVQGLNYAEMPILRTLGDVEGNAPRRREQQFLVVAMRADEFVNDIAAKFDYDLFSAEIATRTVSQILQRDEGLSSEELSNPVLKGFRFDLCPACHDKFLKDPLGKVIDSLDKALKMAGDLIDVLKSTPLQLVLKALGQEPDRGTFGRGTFGGSNGTGSGSPRVAPGDGGITVNIHTGVGDPVRIGREVSKVLSAYAVRGGSIAGAG